MAYNEWIVDTNCNFHSDFENLFAGPRTDVSETTKTYLGDQFDVIGSRHVDWKKLKEWVLAETNDEDVPDIEIRKSWCVDYKDGGYQAVHKHGKGNISVVISLNEQPNEDKAGILYTLTPDQNDSLRYAEYPPRPGRTVILSGGVWHGVYPVKGSRRVFVVDYKIKGKKDGI